MEFLIFLCFLCISNYYLISFFPWWCFIFIPFALGLIFSENYLSHFLSGFIGVSVGWLFLILNIDFETKSIISTKIIEILDIRSVSILIIYTSIIGGFLGGIVSITGKSLKEIFTKKKKKRNYSF